MMIELRCIYIYEAITVRIV